MGYTRPLVMRHGRERNMDEIVRYTIDDLMRLDLPSLYGMVEEINEANSDDWGRIATLHSQIADRDEYRGEIEGVIVQRLEADNAPA